MLCMDPNDSATEPSVKVLQDMDQKSEDQIKAVEVKDDKTEQKSAQESGHYWWCPMFSHFPNCHYLNLGFQDQNYWPPMMSNPYSMPYIQIPNNCDQSSSLSSTHSQSQRRTNIAKKSPKKETNTVEVERLYSCRLCDHLKETKDVTHLRKHIEEHLGKRRPFECRVCGKLFKFRSNCRNHMIAHSVVRKNVHRVSAPIPD